MPLAKRETVHERLTGRFISKKFINQKKNARELGAIQALEDQQIVEHFLSVMMGLGNYYIPVLTFPWHLTQYISHLYYSCLKTLAAKHKTTTRQITLKHQYQDKM